MAVQNNMYNPYYQTGRPNYPSANDYGMNYTPPSNPQQLRTGTYIIVPNESTARNFLLSPGQPATFMNDSDMYMYFKVANQNPLEKGEFHKYKLVEVFDEEEEENKETSDIQYATLADFEHFKNEVLEMVKRKPRWKGNKNESNSRENNEKPSASV